MAEKLTDKREAQRSKRLALVKEATVRRTVQADTDYASIRLQRQKEAADAKAYLLQHMLKPEQLPDSAWRPVRLDTPASVYYLVAAAKEGQILSVIDGKTQFNLFKWTVAKHGAASYPPVYACIHAWTTPVQAVATKFPSYAALGAAPKVLLRVEAKGPAYHHTSTGAWALSQVRLLDILTQMSHDTPLDVHYTLNPVRPTAHEPVQVIRSMADSPAWRSLSPSKAHGTASTSPRPPRLSAHHRRLSSVSPRRSTQDVGPSSPTSWSPPVDSVALVASRGTDMAHPSPPRRPFVVPMPPPERRTSRPRSSSPEAGQAARAAAARHSPRDARDVLKDRPAAGLPGWYLQSVPEKGAEKWAARFHDARPLAQRVDVAAGVDQLYKDANAYLNKALAAHKARKQP